jgi:hypothetical protein
MVRRVLVAGVLVLALASCVPSVHVAPTGSSASVVYDAEHAAFEAWPTYVSFNIDTSTILRRADLGDAVLTELVSNLVRTTPAQLRVGGGEADNLLYDCDGVRLSLSLSLSLCDDSMRMMMEMMIVMMNMV